MEPQTVTLIPVVAGIRNSLGNHAPVQRWINPAFIQQIITEPYGLHVCLANGSLDVTDEAEAAALMKRLGLAGAPHPKRGR